MKTMNLVDVWNEGDRHLSPVLLIREQDFENFQLNWSCGNFESEPSYIFRLMPNGVGSEGVFLHYLHVRYASQFNSSYHPPAIDRLTEIFLYNWEQIQDCIQKNERMKALKERRDDAANTIFDNGLESASDAELVYALADRLKGQAKGRDFARSIVAITKTLMDRYNVN
jgi:hypothetical protein